MLRRLYLHNHIRAYIFGLGSLLITADKKMRTEASLRHRSEKTGKTKSRYYLTILKVPVHHAADWSEERLESILISKLLF